MKNNSLVLTIIAVVVLGGIVFATTRNTPAPQTSSNAPIQSHRTYSLKTDSAGKTYAVNTPNQYSFSIVDERGGTLKDFAITHTKMMHVIVVRKDLAYFQHVHPEYDQTTGTFTFKNLTFPADGEYRIFADFAANSSQMDVMGMPLTTTISEDVPVGIGANYKPQALGTEEKTKTFGKYTVTLIPSSEPLASQNDFGLTFEIKKDGKLVTNLEQYLGALGHSVILSENDLQFIHAHPSNDPTKPQTGKVNFEVTFPEAGKYKIFTQFQDQGQVFTTDFVVSVIEGTKSSPGGTMMHENGGSMKANHNMMQTQ